MNQGVTTEDWLKWFGLLEDWGLERHQAQDEKKKSSNDLKVNGVYLSHIHSKIWSVLLHQILATKQLPVHSAEPTTTNIAL